jgi:hypothetical protein
VHGNKCLGTCLYNDVNIWLSIQNKQQPPFDMQVAAQKKQKAKATDFKPFFLTP